MVGSLARGMSQGEDGLRRVQALLLAVIHSPKAEAALTGPPEMGKEAA